MHKTFLKLSNNVNYSMQFISSNTINLTNKILLPRTAVLLVHYGMVHLLKFNYTFTLVA